MIGMAMMGMGIAMMAWMMIGNLLSIHEPEDDQDDEEHQFPMQPPLSFDAKEPLRQSKI